MPTQFWTIEGNEFVRVPGNRIDRSEYAEIMRRAEARLSAPREVFHCSICENTVERKGAKCSICTERRAETSETDQPSGRKMFFVFIVLLGIVTAAFFTYCAPQDVNLKPRPAMRKLK